jgi:hypothetical protein
MGTIGPLELIITLPILILFIVPFWKIFSKAGFNGWLSLLMLVPGVNIILLFYLAFAEWPILKGPK